MSILAPCIPSKVGTIIVHFRGEKTEVQRRGVTCPRSRGKQVVKLRLVIIHVSVCTKTYFLLYLPHQTINSRSTKPTLAYGYVSGTQHHVWHTVCAQ